MDANSNLEKMKDLYSKTLVVNKLYEKSLNPGEKSDADLFEVEWKKLYREVNNFLFGGDFCFPEKQVIINSKDFDIDTLEKTILKDIDNKTSAKEEKITKAEIYYHILCNQDDASEGNDFPYFGFYLVLSLFNNEEKLSIAIAKSNQGCKKLLKPNFDIENLEISSIHREIKFKSANDFAAIFKFCEDSINIANNIFEEKLLNNIKVCQG